MALRRSSNWKQLLFLILILAITLPAAAQSDDNPYQDEQSGVIDNGPVYSDRAYNENEADSRQATSYEESRLDGIDIDMKQLKEKAEDLNFSEKEEVIKPDSGRRRHIDEMEPAKQNKKGSKPWFSFGGDLGKSLAYSLAFVLLAAALVYLIITLSRKNAGATADENLAFAIKDEISEESLSALNPEDALGNALKQNDFRMAARILYLKNLKLLMEKGLIKPELQKTNMDYVRELQKASIKTNLKNLTSRFEYFWYGESAMDKTTFATYREQSDHFYDDTRLNS